MYRTDSLTEIVIKVFMCVIFCCFGQSGLAKVINLEEHQLENTDEVKIRIVCLGQRDSSSYTHGVTNPASSDKSYTTEMIDFKAKGKFTGFTFIGKAEEYYPQSAKEQKRRNSGVNTMSS